jgi:hypothetical protein
VFLYSHWRSIPLNTRIQIAEKFGIVKVGPTHVRDNYVESDGYRIEDVEKALNIDAIQEFLGVEQTDMVTLLELLVAKIEGREVTPSYVVVPKEVLEVAKEMPSVLAQKKKGRPAKI